MTHTVIALATHQKSLGPVTLHSELYATVETGFNDYRGRKNPERAITILSQHHWELANNEAGCALPWYARRAQVLVDDLQLSHDKLGQHLKIGEVVLELTAETDPCSLMNKLHPGLKEALAPDWRGGGRFKVIRGGTIKQGDEIHWLD